MHGWETRAWKAAPTRVVVVVALSVALVLVGALGVAVPHPHQAQAAGTGRWPHFLRVHVQNRRVDTRLIIEAAYAGLRWESQPGVAADDYLVRVDSTGFVRSIDGKLTFWRKPMPTADTMRVVIESPGVAGGDTFTFGPGESLEPQGATFAAASGNDVADVNPNHPDGTPDPGFIPRFRAPMDFEVFIGEECHPNGATQFLQVTPAWTGRQFVTAPGPNSAPYGNGPLPGSTPPGFYRLRWTGSAVQVLESPAPVQFTQIDVSPNDRGHHDLGVLITHSCDAAGDGVDITGFDHQPDDSLTHQTTFAQAPPFDAGYGWQPYGAIAAQPRESFAVCNYIVLVAGSKPVEGRAPNPACATAPGPPPASCGGPCDPLTGVAGSDRVATAIAVSQSDFGPGGAGGAVLGRADDFADALAGTPLAVHARGPLLLTASTSLDPRALAEIRRVVPAGRTVHLLGGEAALSAGVADALRAAGYATVRHAGDDRYATAVAIATTGLGSPNVVLLATGRDHGDGLCGGAAAAKLGAALLLTDGNKMPASTSGYLGRHLTGRRYALGGPAAAAAPGATRVVGRDRFETCVKVARQFFNAPPVVGIASGVTFPDGLSGGAHAALRGGPLLIASATDLPATVAEYLREVRQPVARAFVYGGPTAVGHTVRNAVQEAIT